MKRSSKYILCFAMALCLILPAQTVFSGEMRPIRSSTSLTAAEQNNDATPILVQSVEMTSDRMVLQYLIAQPKASVSEYQLTAADVADSKSLENFIGQTWHEVTLGNAPIRMVAGEPLLPFVPVKLIVPPGRQVKKVVMTSAQTTRLPGQYLVKPAQPPFPLAVGDNGKKGAPNQKIYSGSKSFPEQNVTVIGTYRSRGIPVFVANLFPIQYNPKTGQILFSQSFTLEVQLESIPDSRQYRPVRPSSNFTFANQVENPELLAQYHSRAVPKNKEDPDYVIITSEAFAGDTGANSISDFQTHKTALGINTEIATIESIRNEFDGVDDAEKIRNYLIDKYDVWGIEFALLVGDTNVIPARQLNVIAIDQDTPDQPYQEDMPADIYFGCLDGPYNDNGNNKWGEPDDGENGGDVDLAFDLFIGRVPADDTGQVANWVSKAIAIDNEDPEGDFKHGHLIAGEHMGGGGIAEYAKPMMELIVHGSDECGYTTVGFDADPSFTTKTLYAQDGDFSANALMSEMNADNWAWINHLGHASPSGVMTMNGSDVKSLTNSKPFFAYSQGCHPGAFDSSDCMAEYFTTHTDSGAFAVVFNARYGFGLSNSLDGPSNRYHRQFWDAVFDEDMRILGQVHADHKEDHIDRINEDVMRWVYYETNLFGDPAVYIIGQGDADIDGDADGDTDGDSDGDTDGDTDGDADGDGDGDGDGDADGDGDGDADGDADGDGDSDDDEEEPKLEDQSCGCRKIGLTRQPGAPLIDLLSHVFPDFNWLR